MKRIALISLIGISSNLFAQQPPERKTFDIEWPDSSKSNVIYSDSIGSFYIQSDSSIEFNAKQFQGEIYIRIGQDEACKGDTSFFSASSSRLKLNGTESCFMFKNYGEYEMLFRNTKNIQLSGRINYKMQELLYCKMWAGSSCLSYESQSVITFDSYTLGTNQTVVPIEAIVLGTEQSIPSATYVSISPNSFNSTLLVESNQFPTFQLLSLEGRIVKSNLATNRMIDMSELENGVYIAQFGEGGVYKRLVKK